MKLKTIIIGLLTSICLSFSADLQAQKIFNDTIFVFNEKADFLLEGFKAEGILGQGFSLSPASKGSLRKISVPVAKKIKVPRATRVSKGPITLKHKGICYTFGCQKGGNCKDCKLVWYDRNGDRKVQPRRELRCVCPSGGKCKIKVVKSKC